MKRVAGLRERRLLILQELKVIEKEAPLLSNPSQMMRILDRGEDGVQGSVVTAGGFPRNQSQECNMVEEGVLVSNRSVNKKSLLRLEGGEEGDTSTVQQKWLQKLQWWENKAGGRRLTPTLAKVPSTTMMKEGGIPLHQDSTMSQGRSNRGH